MFTHLSECLNLSDRRKIRVFFALAPIGRLKHIRSNIRHLAPVSPLAEMGQWLLGGAELLPSTPTGRWVANQMSKVQKSVATISPVVDDKANSLFTSVTGFNPTHYFKKYLPVYSTHTPGMFTRLSTTPGTTPNTRPMSIFEVPYHGNYTSQKCSCFIWHHTGYYTGTDKKC